MTDVFVNPLRDGTVLSDVADQSQRDFHRSMPGYAPTPLHRAPRIAEELGVAEIWIKVESERFGLPSFKVLGASWATCLALSERIGIDIAPGSGWDELADLVPECGLTLAAATDGNHGRAVARIANLLGLACRIYVPRGTASSRIAAIEDEGASVEVVKGTYDDAVARSATHADETTVVVSDMSWPGYERIPRWVIEGYETLFAEIDEQLDDTDAQLPGVIAIQMGVGALAAAAVLHYRRSPTSASPVIVGVEPSSACCVLSSLRQGAITTVPGPHRSIMAGLNCDTPSRVAWPILSVGLDAGVAIEDRTAIEAMRLLAHEGINSGESGAAGLAGLLELARGGFADQLGLGPEARLLVISTEGATDPDGYAHAVGVI